MLSRKDKTLVEILDRLESLEGKIDRIHGSMPAGFGPPQPAPTSEPSFSTDVDELAPSSSLRLTQQPSLSGIGSSQPYRHASAAHKMLTWPAIQQLLLQAFPSNIGDWKIPEQEGRAFILQIQERIPKLTLDDNLQGRPFTAMQSQASRSTGEARATFPRLTRDTMLQLATAYFDTFNLIYPFMDRQNFISDTLAKVYTEGFGVDPDSVIALLVFALGELAKDGSCGNPIEEYKGRPSGVRGGTASTPPGIALFNEARKRIGFVLTGYDLEHIQIYSLAACVTVSLVSDVTERLSNWLVFL